MTTTTGPSGSIPLQDDHVEPNSFDARLRIADVPTFGRSAVTLGAVLRKFAVVSADWLAIFVAFVAARYLSGIPMIVGASAKMGTISMMLAAALGCASFSRVGLYTSCNVVVRLHELKRIIQGTTIGLVVVLASAELLHLRVSRKWATYGVVIVVVFVVVERDLIRRGFHSARQRGRLQRSVLIVGSNAEAVSLYNLIASERGLGYVVAGFVDDHLSPGTEVVPGVYVVGGTAEIQSVARGLAVTGGLIAATAHDASTTNRCVRLLADDGFHVQVTSTLRDIAPERLTVLSIGPSPALYLKPIRRSGLTSAAKRLTDIVISFVGLAASLPILLLAAVAVKIDSPGSVIFQQERAGKGGKSFRIFKLRTMVVNAETLRPSVPVTSEGENELFFKVRRDSRITRVGAFLRRTSIDELPQLFNILKGDMSLVGPRPLPYADTLRAWDEQAANRLRVRPGLTGMWQVSGRSSMSGDDAVRLDLYYVDNWSLWVDVAVLLRTIPAVLGGRGAM
jgi:exopolysaccharide biosynthesis polyprenyl glycosylphosphotransferase